METITFENEVEATIAGGKCLSVKVINKGITPFGVEQVQKYLDRNFNNRRAVSACIGWGQEAGFEMNEDLQMLGA
tara:strand:+ start:3001 stop:3225 length:225 start_codon:yes stop_codon:yes gene_type:complete